MGKECSLPATQNSTEAAKTGIEKKKKKKNKKVKKAGDPPGGLPGTETIVTSGSDSESEMDSPTRPVTPAPGLPPEPAPENARAERINLRSTNKACMRHWAKSWRSWGQQRYFCKVRSWVLQENSWK